MIEAKTSIVAVLAALSLLLAAGTSQTFGQGSASVKAPQSQPAGESGTAATKKADQTKPLVKSVTSKDGTKIAYERTGEGPTVILVAGALSGRSSSAGMAALLAKKFTVINYDRRGRGDSGDTQPYAVEREVEDIEALIDAAGGSACVFGSSSGAVLALEAATRLPSKVKKAALYEPPFIVDDSRPPVPDNFAEHLRELAASGKRSEAVEYFMVDGVGVPEEFVVQMKQAPMWPDMEKLAHTIAYDATVMGKTQAGKPLPLKRWEGATMPVLVMCGGASDEWIQHAAAALAKVLPHAKQRIIEGQDHSAAIMAPQTLTPALLDFFTASDTAK